MIERTFIIETPEQKRRLAQFIERRELPFQAGIGPVRSQRSTSQNSRLWALHALAAEATGHAPDELHEMMLCKFFGTKEIVIGGVRHTVPLKRSSTREKQEFRQFLDNVEDFYACELGVWFKDEVAA